MRESQNDQDAPHDARCHGQEVSPILPLHALDFDEPEVGLVHERRGLNSLAGALVPHGALRDALQLFVNERNKLVQG